MTASFVVGSFKSLVSKSGSGGESFSAIEIDADF